MTAQENLRAIESNKRVGCVKRIEEVAADKGYHSADALELCQRLNLRTYISEPKRTGEWNWSERSADHERAVGNNRRRMKRSKGRRLGRLRSERVERSFAHVCESGSMRRTWLRGLAEVTKRYLIATAAHNLGRVLWKLLGVGKPRGLQGFAGLFAAMGALTRRLFRLLDLSWLPSRRSFRPAQESNAVFSLAG